MKFSIVKNNLTTGCLDLFSHVISEKSSSLEVHRALTVSVKKDSIEFEGFSIHGALQVVNSTPETVWNEGKVHVPFGAFNSLVKSLDKADSVIIEERDSSLYIKGLRGEKKLMEVDLVRFPRGFTAMQMKNQGDFPAYTYPMDSLSQIFSLIDKQDFQFRFRGIFFRDNTVIGGGPGALGILTTRNKIGQLYGLDPNCIDVVKSFESPNFEFGEEHCRITDGNGKKTYQARYLTTQIPSIDYILEDGYKGRAVLPKSELKDTLKRALSMASEDKNIRNSNLTFSSDGLTIQNINAEKGRGQFYAPSDTEKPFEASTKLKHLFRAVSACKGDKVTIDVTPDSSLIRVRDDNLTIALPKTV